MSTPQCCVCGRFTTHRMERYMSSSHPYGEDDRWYCKEHDSSRVAS